MSTVRIHGWVDFVVESFLEPCSSARWSSVSTRRTIPGSCKLNTSAIRRSRKSARPGTKRRGQAAYRIHPMFVPNDPQYATLQWNLPLINMERAWDIQPQAGSSITVAVVDTGIAYRNATLSVNIPAFRNEGILYPALGPQIIPY